MREHQKEVIARFNAHQCRILSERAQIMINVREPMYLQERWIARLLIDPSQAFRLIRKNLYQRGAELDRGYTHILKASHTPQHEIVLKMGDQEERIMVWPEFPRVTTQMITSFVSLINKEETWALFDGIQNCEAKDMTPGSTYQIWRHSELILVSYEGVSVGLYPISCLGLACLG
jgi:hypothetical protein